MALKIYKHTGSGHYIGSCIIVVADSMNAAENLIKYELVSQGLPNERVDIKEMPIKKDAIIYSNNGDY